MRNHLIIPTLLLAASQLGAAITPGRLGLCLGNTFANNSLKGYGDFVADLQAIKKLAPDVKLVRTYGAGGKPNSTAQSILKAAKQEGFQVLLGTWIQGLGATGDTFWQIESHALTEAIPGYEEQVYGITVGSEGLYRYYQQNDDNGGYTSTKLAGYLTEAMKTWPNISIGTADTTSSYVSGWADEVIRLVPSMLLANAFPYWTAQYMQNATANSFDQVLSALTHIQNITNDSDKIHFMVGEAGWPGSGGDDYATAVASTANAQTYFNEAVCPMLAHGIDVFWFEAFDEPGKAGATTNLPNGLQVTLNENFWGAMTSTRDFKLNMTCPETLET